jgi:hypothetical protein
MNINMNKPNQFSTAEGTPGWYIKNFISVLNENGISVEINKSSASNKMIFSVSADFIANDWNHFTKIISPFLQKLRVIKAREYREKAITKLNSGK